MAIELVLTLRLVFHLALRQTEAFSRSVLRLLGLALSIADHSTLNRRGRAFARWQPRVQTNTDPIHLVLDSTGLELFGQGECDAEKHGRLRRQWRKLHLAVDAGTGEIVAHVLTADGAYDGEPTYAAAAARQRHAMPDVVIPPRSSAVPSSGEADNKGQSLRDRHIQLLAERIGPKLRARSLLAQKGEVAIAVAVPNKMIRTGKLVSVRVA